jgi:aryl-alcohol dehydrogenase-like predicted oxidoreductase
MKTNPFGKTGLNVSVIGFGAAPIGFLQTDQNKVNTILHLLLDSGVNLIDTAAMYAGSEELIGQSVAKRRGEFILVSKCGHAYPDLPGEAWSETLILATIDRALKRLATDHLDVMLLHTCDLATLKKGEGLGALVKARAAGKVRFAGYSGDNEAAAYAATLPEIAVIETSINIADQANIDLVLPAAKKHNVGVIVKRPIANAAWKAPSAQEGAYVDYASTYHDRLKKMAITPAELGFTGDPAVAWPEIALRFTLAQDGIGAAIVGTTKPASARANIAAANRGPLGAEAVAKIRAAFKKAEKASGEKWTGQG